MKRMKFLFLSMLMSVAMLQARIIVPDNYTAVHSDSSWHITMSYYVDDVPDNEQLLLTSSICCPDTCVCDTTRCFQGKKYRKAFLKEYGYTPTLSAPGIVRCTMVVPETMVGDSMIAVTDCTVQNKKGLFTESDSLYIYLPQASPLSCHRVSDAETSADRVAYRHRCIFPMSFYQPLNENNIPSYSESPFAVNYRPASYVLENGYMQNGNLIDTLANLISSMLADSLAQIEVVQIVGYSSPDNSEKNINSLGAKRASSLRDKLKYHCNLPDSVFEIIDGGRNWELIYESMGGGNIAGGDSMVTILRAEKAPARRETLIRGMMNGNVLKYIGKEKLQNQRQACCARIYYQNRPDSVAGELNKVVNELMTNETPDYDSLRNELAKYGDDARALNLMGVIDYREHRRNAAKKAFSTAALMGDEQALTNLLIITREY